MANANTYTLVDDLSRNTDFHIYRAIHRPTGASVVIKAPQAEVPSERTIGRLAHEYKTLTHLAQVAGVIHAQALERRGASTALIMEDPGWTSLGRVLEKRE